jgi:hypothetical protein
MVTAFVMLGGIVLFVSLIGVLDWLAERRHEAHEHGHVA